jgi:tripeptidyl-peptidase-2
VEGLTGRTLRLNPAWVNPSGEWRVGARPLFELLPGGLCKRLKEERRKELVCR